MTSTQAQAAPAVRNDGNGRADDERPPRLLVVDDVEDNRRILLRRFKRRGFEIEEAAGGREALAMIEKGGWDVVLLDIMMPDIDGMEVLARTRQTHSPDDLPIIMVTAKSESTDVVAALEGLANDYVTKPVDFDVCLARVNAQVARRRLAERQRARADVVALDQRRLQEDRDAKGAELVHLSLHDRLTDIPHRAALIDEIRRTLAGRGSSSGAATDMLICVGFDGFRAINESRGQAAGDGLLRAAAQRICTWAREFRMSENPFVARVGGDEFAVILRDCDARSALAATETLSRALATAFEIDEGEVFMTASCGIASAGPAEASPDDLVRRARAAMVAAKKAGPGGVLLFEPSMLESLERRHSLQLDLRGAQARGEFDLHFQPLIDAKKNHVAGFEALLRWRHPTKGYVPPDEFIPLAEESGVINEIGEWVLRRACSIAAGWDGDYRVAVNLSPRQIAQTDFIATLVSALANSGLPAERLELELTETSAVDCSDETRGVLRAIRNLGVSVSIDDFGTGFASMSYLQKLDFDKIKIDKSFIDELGNEANRRAGMIVRSIIALGERMGVVTTAEGVETATQVHLLRSEGCGEIQGYYYAKPMPAGDVAGFLKGFHSTADGLQ